MTDRIGWICPRCDSVNSPDVLLCNCQHQLLELMEEKAATEKPDFPNIPRPWPNTQPPHPWTVASPVPPKWDWTIICSAECDKHSTDFGAAIYEALKKS